MPAEVKPPAVLGKDAFYLALTPAAARAIGEVYCEGFDIIAKPYSADSLVDALSRTIAKAKLEHMSVQLRELA